MEIILTSIYTERNGEWIEKAKQALKVQQLRMQYEEMETKLLKELKSLSENVSSKGGGITFTASIRKGSVDYGSIPELRTVDLELYRKPHTETWKLGMELE